MFQLWQLHQEMALRVQEFILHKYGMQSSGMRIDLEWDASTNVKGLILGAGIALEPTNGHFDFRSFGGIKNNAGGGITGDIDLTTLHHTANDAYTIILELSKSY